MHVYICKFMLRFNIERYTDYQFMADVDILTSHLSIKSITYHFTQIDSLFK